MEGIIKTFVATARRYFSVLIGLFPNSFVLCHLKGALLRDKLVNGQCDGLLKQKITVRIQERHAHCCWNLKDSCLGRDRKCALGMLWTKMRGILPSQ